MSNVLGFLTSPTGTLLVTLAVACLAPVIALPCERLLDRWGRRRRRRIAAEPPGGDHNEANMNGDGNNLTQIIDRSRTDIRIDATAGRRDDAADPWLLLLLGGVGLVALIGGFLTVGLAPILVETAVVAGVCVGGFAVQVGRGTVTATGAINAVAAVIALIVALLLPTAELEGRNWDQVSVRLERFDVLQRFWEMGRLEGDLVIGVLLAALALALLGLLLILSALAEWAASTDGSDPVRRWLAGRRMGVGSQLVVVLLLLVFAVFFGLNGGFHVMSSIGT